MEIKSSSCTGLPRVTFKVVGFFLSFFLSCDEFQNCWFPRHCHAQMLIMEARYSLLHFQWLLAKLA